MKQKVEIVPHPTKEERDIVSLLASGLRGNHVAEKLRTTESVLAAKLSSIRYRYGAKNSVELAVIFCKAGFI